MGYQQKSILHISSLDFFPLTDFTFKCLYLTPCYALFSHHAHQTPSLRSVVDDHVPHQIQVDQSRVLFEAFGQGLTGEIWTMSAALELTSLSDPFSISLTSLSIACILLLAMPFCLTILAKHQAFAPSSVIMANFKFKFFKVEFALRPSAKAFESSS